MFADMFGLYPPFGNIWNIFGLWPPLGNLFGLWPPFGNIFGVLPPIGNIFESELEWNFGFGLEKVFAELLEG